MPVNSLQTKYQEVENQYNNFKVTFPEKYHKINKNLKFKKMVVVRGNVMIDIPLSLPINYQKEFSLEEKYWILGTNVLLNY